MAEHHRPQRLSRQRERQQTVQTPPTSLPSVVLLLLSLRSLYSLLPFLRSSPSSFSLFPFSFLVSLSSLLLTLALSPQSPSPSPSPSPHPPLLLAKSALLASLFLLRFQALRFCGTSATILAEFSGNAAASYYFLHLPNHHRPSRFWPKLRGFSALLSALLLLSISWDRIDCFPFTSSNLGPGKKFMLFPGSDKCFRISPMLLPFISGFLGCYERMSMNWGSIRQLGRKRVRFITLFYTTIMLFIPAVISFFFMGESANEVSIANLGWPLLNTVVFGVFFSENYGAGGGGGGGGDEKLLGNNKDFQREFAVTFVCTIVLELFYFPELSLWGLLLCGFFLWVSVRELDSLSSNYLELGLDSSSSFSTIVMKPIRHILSERKSRKIALFLLINTAYMVVEFVAGFMSNSLGLISDACHMLFDCAALAIGLYASYISRLPANAQFNYGRGRFEILSGYVNAVFLVLVGSLIVLESFERILDPQEISTNSLLSVSIGGLVVNVVGLIFFHEEHHHAHGGGGSCSHSHSHSHNHHSHSHSHDVDDHKSHGGHHRDISITQENLVKHDHDHHSLLKSQAYGDGCSHTHCDRPSSSHVHEDGSSFHDHSSLGSTVKPLLEKKQMKEPEKHHHHHIDHNMEGIFLHVLADTMGSVGVVISTLLIQYKGWLVADPACSIFISVLIVSSVIPLLRNSAEILLQRVPRAHEKDLKLALNDVMRISGVHSISNVHVWSLTNTDVVGTVHVRLTAGADKASTKSEVSQILHDVGIKDLTIQVEYVRGFCLLCRWSLYQLWNVAPSCAIWSSNGRRLWRHVIRLSIQELRFSVAVILIWLFRSWKCSML
ncbi:hypothetical protein Sjap_015962 [Stephania japonica]|uniref:Cation efflux protein transmembrane domain-containing protein n=1 Tax=Stephania japonica TaxID=461633 RepID=A0AAP0IKY7_9MAGN